MTIIVRNFRADDALPLRDVYRSSIHQLTRGEYDEAQRNAWAPSEFDEQAWSARIASICPFVALFDDSIAGYADIQNNGYIDHFFVSPQFAKRGIGSALMKRINAQATTSNLR